MPYEQLEKVVPSTRDKGKTRLEPLCQALLRADPDIREIIQFGSSVYAPDLALDVDLLVVTSARKESDVYWDAVSDWPVHVDVLVKETGERIGPGVAQSICGAHQILWGTEETPKEVQKGMSVPTYQEARKITDAAEHLAGDAREATDSFMHDRYYRLAFNTLFDAARTAAMSYLSTEETRWGELRRALPQVHAQEFRQIINTLHIVYSYEGQYPREDAAGEFARWRARVNRFITALEQEGR